MNVRIGIDLGGTNIVAGIVAENYSILAKASVPTRRERNAGEIIDDMVHLVEKLVQEQSMTMEDITSIGLGVPGTANKESGLVEYANNLSFDNVPVIAILKERFNKEVFLGNDGNAAAWGEYLAGAGIGLQNGSLVAVTLGTGIGGGIILNGEIFEGTNYGAAEFGHMSIDYKGIPCNCGRVGCFEQYASATAFIEQAKRAMQANKKSALWERCQNELEQVDGKMICAACLAGDPTAVEMVDAYTTYLAVGVTNIINIFQPDLLCIGGGISLAGELIRRPLQEKVAAAVYTRTAKKQTQICIAKLHNDAGIIGAAFLDA